MRASSTRDSLTAQSLIEPNSPHHEMVVLQRINVTTQRPPLRTGLLLQLPNPAVEQRFWSDEGVTRSYANLDTFFSLHLIVTNLTFMRAFGPALTNMSLFKHTWHVHLIIVFNIVTCMVNLLLIHRFKAVYVRRRHSVVFLQRLLRLTYPLLTLLRGSDVGQAALAQALNSSMQHVAVGGGNDNTTPVAMAAAVAGLARPLMVTPVQTLSQGAWMFQATLWLPLQLLGVVLALANSFRHQQCRLVTDSNSALLLQPTCHAMSTLHRISASSLLGPLFVGLEPTSSSVREAACGNMAVAARMLLAYGLVVYGLVMPIVGTLSLEWRLKSKWVQKTYGRQLVYGPLAWRESCYSSDSAGPSCGTSERSSFASVLQSLLTWLLSTASSLWAAWYLMMWLVPSLPAMTCPGTCESMGACRQIAPCGHFLCGVPGAWLGLVVHAQMLVTHLGHLTSTYLASAYYV